MIGSILAAHLLRNETGVVLADTMKSRLDSIREKGLSVSDPAHFTHGSFTARAAQTCCSLSEAVRLGAETIFICVKAPAIRSLLPELRAVCGGQSRVKVVSFQNGLDTEELLARAAGRENVLRAVVNYAGRLAPDGAAEIAFFNGPNYIGALEAAAVPRARAVCGALTAAGLETRYSGEVKRQVWEKVILNSVLSPISALTGMTMRQAMRCPATLGLVRELAREAIEVAGRSGIGLPKNFLEFCVSYLNKAGHHKPSMLVDIETTGRTEIEFLNGKICEYAEKNKVAVPFHKAICALVKGVESRKNSQP
ncbi:MAG: ketopantoate reductase family protein [Elusimicrobia bacterium]|nr:ketopantoate reductase family protein [Elusimicrobiota bacterium]